MVLVRSGDRFASSRDGSKTSPDFVDEDDEKSGASPMNSEEDEVVGRKSSNVLLACEEGSVAACETI